MSFFKFKEEDVIRHHIKTYPYNHFLIYNNNIFYNQKPSLSGVLDSSVGLTPDGHISLYEMNVDRSTASDTYNADTQTGNKALIRPFTYKSNNSYASTFKSITNQEFFNKKPTRDSNGNIQLPILTGSYPMSSSLSILYYAQDQYRPHVDALKNICNNYTSFNPHYQFSSSLYARDFASTPLSLLNIPSIFYGEKQKKGGIDLKFYISGTLAGHLSDVNRNGTLVEIKEGSVLSGSVEGVVLYNEGIQILTGTNNQSTIHSENYVGAGNDNPKWVYFGSTLSSSQTTISSSYTVEFKGQNTIPVLTMNAHAKSGQLNHSNNPSFIRSGSFIEPTVTSTEYKEDESRKIVNIVSSSYIEPTGSFEKITYISSINLYDEYRNLIGIAKLSKPIKKTESRDLTFKQKLDL